MPPSRPVLPRSWKKRYRFRTATTSFIFPAGYAENVARLGPYVDEIELLMFESKPESRPSRGLVNELATLGRDHDVRYNVHLPVDLDLTHPDAPVRRKACRVLGDFVAALLPLDPTVFVLHLPPPATVREDAGLTDWQETAVESVENVMSAGLDGRRMALENLFHPFAWSKPVVEALDLSVCLDTGHLALQGEDLEDFLTAWAPRIAITHLHGIEKGRDHKALNGLPSRYRIPLTRWLSGFDGTASVEVFALDPLRESLNCLDRMMASTPRDREGWN